MKCALQSLLLFELDSNITNTENISIKLLPNSVLNYINKDNSLEKTYLIIMIISNHPFLNIILKMTLIT